MKIVLAGLVILVLAGITGLLVWRQSDRRADAAEMARLRAFQPKAPALFDPAMVADLPEPARRYFFHAIAASKPLFTVAKIEMTRQFSLGTKDTPNYLPMRA